MDMEIKKGVSPSDGYPNGRPAKNTFAWWLKLIGINLIAFGLELCSSAGFCYIPPILLKRGFSGSALTVILGIGPFISFMLVPLIGHWSDHCRSVFGRRRPFIIVLGVLIIYSLLIIPFNGEISDFFGLIDHSYCLVFGIILLDFSTQAIMNPCKALIPDLYKTTEEQNYGFTAYSFMLSMGGGIGYLLSSINWENTSLGENFGGQEKAIFCILAISFLLLLVLTLFFATETPLLDSIYSSNEARHIHRHDEEQCETLFNGPSYSDKSLIRFSPILRNPSSTYIPFFPQAKIRSWFCQASSVSKCLCWMLKIPLKLFTALKFNFLYFYRMPTAIRNLFVSCLFGWMGIMCHDLFYTDFVAQVIYKGKPEAENKSSALNLYNQGIRMGSWGLLLHCLSAAIYSALFQHHLIKAIGQRKTYIAGIIVFTLSLVATVLSRRIIFVNLFTALSGAGYVALTTVPCTLITTYHSSEKFNNNIDQGIGEDLAVLDSAFYLSQIIPSLFLGCMVDLSGTSSTYMIVAALFGAVAIFVSFCIKFPEEKDID